MSVGQGCLVGNLSYLAFGREVTYGTYATCTSGINFLSASLKTTKEVKVLEEIQTSRTNSNSIQLGKTVEGEAEFYFSPKNPACNYLLQNAFGGGPVTSATATGETIGGLAFTHQIDIANFAATYSSLSANMRKGQATDGKIFEYTGLRVNELTIKAELDEALICSIGMMGKNSTITANDVSSVLTTLTQEPLSFVNGRLSIETTNALTTSSYWLIESMEFKLSNNLSGDQRNIGSDVIQCLPAGMAKPELKCKIRFDTTTAYDAMMNGTRFYGEFEFLGNTLTGSKIREGLKVSMPYLLITEAGDPEVGGPNEILSSEVSFTILRDASSATGYAVRSFVTNLASSYA